MRTRTFQLITLTASLCIVGCSESGEEPIFGNGGAQGVGGMTANGGSAVGNGGAAPAGGKAGLGGSPGTGGSSAISAGGRAESGGAAAGGADASGGKASGGTKASGGSTAAGGADASGGKASGGRASGGANAAGGADASGGKASGGTYASGGKAAGGASTAGGSTAAGGMTSAGGSSALPKFVGNITTGNSVNPSGLNYAKYWDQITPENQGKWGSVQSTPSSAFNWGSLDSIYKYTQDNNILFKQHVFVWGAQQPNGTPTLAQVENWIKSFCQRYPNVKLIDVVNEPPPHTTPNYTANLGAGEGGSWPWITKAFKLARQYCGSAILILNDYNNIEYADQEQHFIDIVKDIKANGAPIDAVGCQAHGLKGKTSSQVQTNINKMATDTGLPVYITEYDIGDANDSTQSTNFQNHFSVFLNTASIKGITVWGWINGSTWISNSGIVNGTTPRPAMTWLMQQLKRPVPPN